MSTSNTNIEFQNDLDLVRFGRLLDLRVESLPHIFVIHGREGSGKSTLSKKLQKREFRGTVMVEPVGEIYHNSMNGHLIIEVQRLNDLNTSIHSDIQERFTIELESCKIKSIKSLTC